MWLLYYTGWQNILFPIFYYLYSPGYFMDIFSPEDKFHKRDTVPESLNLLDLTEACLVTAARKYTKWAALDKTNCGCAPSEDSDQPGHPPSLIRVFAVHMKKTWVLSYLLSTQQRLWSDWDAQADLTLRWAHSHFVGFVMRWLNSRWQHAYHFAYQYCAWFLMVLQCTIIWIHLERQ